MARIAYVDGQYLPLNTAQVSVEDRGFQFADGIYEVCTVRNGRFLDYDGHMARLQRSLRELRIDCPVSIPALTVIMREVMRRNRVREGIVYIQITRGAAPRDHPFPTQPVRPTLVVISKSVPRRKGDTRAEQGIRVVTHPDLRWGRCDIKTVGLLPNVLAIQHARDHGAEDAWLIDEAGQVREGTRSNVWIVTADGALVTRQLDNRVLHGITRQTLMEVAAVHGLRVEEREFTLEEALAAREAFMTSASALVLPVVQIDDRIIGNGHPGSLSLGLRAAYIEAAEAASQA